MEAPEKIYLEKIYPDNGVLPNGLNYNQSINDIEYIRTDVFIKKAKLWLAEIHRVCDITDEHGYRIELRELRARFEIYMKGE